MRPGENEYVVERVEGKKVVEGKTYYFVKWEGWPASHSTWEPESNLRNIQSLLDDYNHSAEGAKLTDACLDLLKEQHLSDSSYGSFRFGDVPLRVLQLEVVFARDRECEINCVVAWAQRKNGEQPKNSVVSNAALKQRAPVLLIDYYESKIKVLSRREKAKKGLFVPN